MSQKITTLCQFFPLLTFNSGAYRTPSHLAYSTRHRYCHSLTLWHDWTLPFLSIFSKLEYEDQKVETQFGPLA